MKSCFRIVALLLLGIATALADESPPVQLAEKTLVVSITAADRNTVAQALDLRDLEHFAVSELKRRRLAAIAFTSVEESLESTEGPYAAEIGIDQADIAERPKWNRLDQRFLDDEILHLELSLSVTRLADGENLGSLFHAYDYRAEDYGRFSSPQAVRGAAYEAVAALMSDFAAGVERGDFGGDLQQFQHPFALQDALDLFSQLSTAAKVGLVVLVLLLVVLCLGLTFRLLDALLGLFVPRRPAPQVVIVRQESRFGRRKMSAVLDAPDPEPDEDAGTDEEEEMDQPA